MTKRRCAAGSRGTARCSATPTRSPGRYRTLKIHIADNDVRSTIAAVNDTVELRSFTEIIPSMNDIFIRAVNGSLK